MSWPMALFTFLNAWWICLFIALPFGRESGEKPDIAYKGAPAGFNWKKSFLIATLLSLAITSLLALIINSTLIVVDDML